MPASYRYLLVDVFTDTPLAGNRLCVFTNAMGMSDELMQRLALEFNFSETTFVTPAERGGHAKMRIFTPTRELPFAGHPTLGTAFALAGPLQSSVVTLETGAGKVPVQLEREGAKLVFGRMEQPLPRSLPCEHSEEILGALGVERSELPLACYDNGVRHLFVALPNRNAVAALKPNFAELERIAPELCYSCFCAEGAKVKTREFAPGLGVIEDPATGSAAGPLAVHLARNGVIEWGEQIVISQGAEIARPSRLYACAEAVDGVVTRVEVGGSAVVVGRGEFRV